MTTKTVAPSSLRYGVSKIPKSLRSKESIEKTYERINVTLPRRTLTLIDRVALKGERSKVIDAAVLQYIRKTSAANLRRGLKEGARRNAESDLALAGEWFSVDEETWPKSKK